MKTKKDFKYTLILINKKLNKLNDYQLSALFLIIKKCLENRGVDIEELS